MSYILKLYDTPLVEFDMASEGRELAVSVSRFDRASTHLLPLEWHITERAGTIFEKELERPLASWLRHRSVPANRAYVKSFLARMGLAEHDVQGIVDISRGLSLNDTYWVDQAADEKGFENVNLYDNPFSRTIAYTAFTGTGSYGVPGYSTSPEFTTNGMYAKCWRRLGGTIYLFKEGSVGAANSGGEPYAEYYASNAAEQLGIDAVHYDPARWKGHFCSKCPLFTSKDTGFISAGRLMPTADIHEVARQYATLGKNFSETLSTMLAFDALIANTDRHLGNFGFLIDNASNRIIAPAPLFDHGCSLFFQAMREDLENLGAYASQQTPRLYTSFIETAREHLGPAQRDMLRHALELSLKKHVRYNLPDWRLEILERFIHGQARALLG